MDTGCGLRGPHDHISVCSGGEAGAGPGQEDGPGERARVVPHVLLRGLTGVPLEIEILPRPEIHGFRAARNQLRLIGRVKSD